MDEPAFLRRLRAAASGAGRQERHIAPRNRKTHVDDEDDEPQYVLEDGSIVTKAEIERMERGEDSDGEEAPGGADVAGGSGASKDGTEAVKAESLTSQVVEAGAKKKRKAVKVVGADADEEEEDQPTAKKGKSDEKPTDPKKKKVGKKAKKEVKLSFGDDE